MLEKVLALLLAASWVYWLAACWLVRSFFRHGHAAEPGPAGPPVSILKPVRGLDAGAYDNFASFCRQDYPDYEIVFGVAEEDDPAVPVIRRLQRDFPERDIRLIVAPPFAPNRKACLLHRLAAVAKHEILAMSDSDMRVTPDYLRRVTAPLADPKVGLVTCPYVGGDVRSFPAALEALHMGVTFLPSVVVARKVMAMRLALGASVVMRRVDLDQLGGFAALSDYLAEDFQVGYQTATKLGLKVHLSDYVITSVIGEISFREEWSHELRWMRCNRVSRPREYPGLLLTSSTALATLLALASGFGERSQQALLVTLVLRFVAGWLVAGYTHDRASRHWLAWLPVRDALSALVWVAGGVGETVSWRGEHYRLEPGGRMRPARPEEMLAAAWQDSEEGGAASGADGDEDDVADGSYQGGGQGARFAS